jgi:GH43 family beta-xylosidase
MNDEWVEMGKMQASEGDERSFTEFSLDMTYFENNGKHYLVWAEKLDDSSLFMAEINPQEPWKLISKPILLTKPEYDWEKIRFAVNEGPAVLKTDEFGIGFRAGSDLTKEIDAIIADLQENGFLQGLANKYEIELIK